MSEAFDGSNYAQPTDDGHFGEFGGRFVAETLTHALDEFALLYDQMKHDLEVVAQGHLVLILIVGLVLLTSATFMKRLDGAAVARRKTE